MSAHTNACRARFFSTHNPTHNMRCLVQLPRTLAVSAACKLLNNLVPLLCHGRGRGFDSLRPRITRRVQLQSVHHLKIKL